MGGEWQYYCEYSMNSYGGEFDDTVAELLDLVAEFDANADVVVSLTLDGLDEAVLDKSSDERAAFEAQFVAALVTALGVDASAVTIVSVGLAASSSDMGSTRMRNTRRQLLDTVTVEVEFRIEVDVGDIESLENEIETQAADSGSSLAMALEANTGASISTNSTVNVQIEADNVLGDNDVDDEESNISGSNWVTSSATVLGSLVALASLINY